jgi:hypothetical protein
MREQGRSAASRHRKEAATSFDALGDGLRFRLAFDEETELTGLLAAKLYVSSSTTDADLFVTLRALRPDGSEITFFGSSDQAVPLAQGWLRASHRKLDPRLSTDYRPYHSHDEKQPLTPGEPAGRDLADLPRLPGRLHARAADRRARLRPQGRRAGGGLRGPRPADEPRGRRRRRPQRPLPWLGGLPAQRPVDRPAELHGGTTTIHTGGSFDSYLLVPVIPLA